MAPKKEDLYTKALASRNLFVADIINICTTVLGSLAEDPIDAEAIEENYTIWLDKWQTRQNTEVPRRVRSTPS